MRWGLELKWPELCSQIQCSQCILLSKVQAAPLQPQNQTGGGAGPGTAHGLWGATPWGLCILCVPKVTKPAPGQHQAVRLLHLGVLSAPRAAAWGFPPSPPPQSAQGVGWPPRGCLRSRESVQLIPGEVLSSQGQHANTGWQQHCLRQRRRPVQLVSYPQGNLWNVRKGTAAAREGRSVKSHCGQPTLLAPSSPLATQEWQLCFHTTEPTCPQLPARLSQAHLDT